MNNEEKIEFIESMAKQGKNMADISQSLGVSDKTVQRFIKSQGYPNDWFRKIKEQAKLDVKIDNVISLIKEDYNLKEIAGKLHMNLPVIVRELNKRVLDGLLEYPKCELCGKEHKYDYGQGRFCSSVCARSFSTKNLDEESKKKRDAGIRKATVIKNKIFEEINRLHTENNHVEYPLEIIIDGKSYIIENEAYGRTADYKEKYAKGINTPRVYKKGKGQDNYKKALEKSLIKDFVKQLEQQYDTRIKESKEIYPLKTTIDDITVNVVIEENPDNSLSIEKLTLNIIRFMSRMNAKFLYLNGDLVDNLVIYINGERYVLSTIERLYKEHQEKSVEYQRKIIAG